MSGESNNTFPCAYDLSDYVHNGQYNTQLHTNTSLVNEVNTIPVAEPTSDHGTISIGIDCNLDRYLNCPFGTLAQGTFLDLNAEEKSGLAHAIAYQCIGSSDTTLSDTNSNGGKQRVRVEKKSQRQASGPYYNHERFSSGPGDNFSPHQKASHLLEVPTVDTRLKAHVLTRALSHVQPPTRLPPMPWHQHPLRPQPGAQGTEAQSYSTHLSQQVRNHGLIAVAKSFFIIQPAHQPAADRVDSLSDGSQLATADPDLTVRTQKSLPEERRQAHLYVICNYELLDMCVPQPHMLWNSGSE
ncbi:hypothetical protein SARC_02007 [Sphaeroforma arctica JP610]|uniref:Uncharacterized protein n=1 Tax=Sphaeroforma arctica JP610 TaxID=667725 RepID=A0A0L0GA88_9EUKA|nr:hypothetical protein SARC_02007 [Sphaeroforma arctica JP610]KNC85824.1 hypothetical protein SARC_02007 [Sphaeroforma arctica JP610]|eukprot:XP_014159726.1 hypothetical protein SARC_02007 [Sphaeroforma arctica JP610]